jgi:uncharacterized membrane protein
MESTLIGMLIIACGTLIGSGGALCLKFASNDVHRNIFTVFKSRYIYYGAILFGISSIMYVYALGFGDLSALYPVAGLSYVWVSLLSMKFLKEKMDGYRWMGIFLIVCGIVLIGLGA